MRLIRPLIIAAVVAAFWISGVAGSGTGLWVELAGVGTGIVLGLADARSPQPAVVTQYDGCSGG
jgi:hypothetical protein